MIEDFFGALIMGLLVGITFLFATDAPNWAAEGFGFQTFAITYLIARFTERHE